ncbi:unnamed protein product, partial [Darwinula stevensoni]
MGLRMEIFAIADGHVLPYILDPNFEEYLPIIPSDVSYVNFTWKSGKRKYEYNFDRLQSFNEDILQSPFISVETKGEVPKKPQMFTLYLPCSGNVSGIASFGIGLMIQTRRGKSLPGTPLRLRLRKECSESCKLRIIRHIKQFSFKMYDNLHCSVRLDRHEDDPMRQGFYGLGPDPECDRKCANGGWCNHEKFCQCPEGYMGKYCMTALCYPQCMNGGTCTAPGVCSCPPGYQGRHCEGGICSRKCLNRGKCIQKDTCACRKGYYGERCEFSKCVIPCLNGGRCRGANICKCPPGFKGSHCEITPNYKKMAQQHSCHKPCHHGYCLHGNRCNCKPGWHGRYCQH